MMQNKDSPMLDQSQLSETIDDLHKEESDHEFEAIQEVRVKFKRPPKTPEEALSTL